MTKVERIARLLTRLGVNRCYISGLSCGYDIASAEFRLEAANPDCHERIDLELPYTCSGDYVGSTVETANRNVLTDEYGIVRTMSFGYGAESAIVSLADLLACHNPNHADHGLIDALKDLQRYPCVNDDELWQVESALMSEDWKGYGFDDIVRELRYRGYTPNANCNYETILNCDTFREAWYDNSHAESANSFYFDADRIIDRSIDALVSEGYVMKDGVDDETLDTVDPAWGDCNDGR